MIVRANQKMNKSATKLLASPVITGSNKTSNTADIQY